MTIYAGSHYNETIRKAESLQRFNNDDGTIAHVIKFEGKHRLIDSGIVTKEEYELARETQEKRELAESLIKQGHDMLNELGSKEKLRGYKDGRSNHTKQSRQ